MNNGAFLAFNTVLGLLVNMLTLGGIVLGVIELQPGWGVLSKPGPVLALLYLFMAILWLLAGFAMINKIKWRYDIGPNQSLNPTDEWQSIFSLMMHLVTIPTTVLWILAFNELIGVDSLDSGRPNDPRFYVALIGGASLLFGGSLTSYIVLSVDWLFSPRDYTKQP